MIVPFHYDPDQLKGASYEVALGGPCVYWDEFGNRVYQEVGTGDQFTLEANSIAFVTLEPEFRIPDYLAVRFNLRIKLVYQGLLLGTGPLVDPGFAGRLSLPLHNWTDNDYTLVGGDGLIWLEVTKLSPAQLPKRSKDPVERRAEMFRLPAYKSNQGLLYYLHHADENRPIRSSIPVTVERAGAHAQASAQSAADAAGAARRTGNLLTFAAIVGLAALSIGLATMLATTFGIVSSADTTVSGARSEVAQARATQDRVAALESRVCMLEMQAGHQPPPTCPAAVTPAPASPSPKP